MSFLYADTELADDDPAFWFKLEVGAVAGGLMVTLRKLIWGRWLYRITIPRVGIELVLQY